MKKFVKFVEILKFAEILIKNVDTSVDMRFE